MKPRSKAILFFDGDCALCSRSVRFLIRKDQREHLYFAPLQGVSAQAILPETSRASLSSIVYQHVAADGQTQLLFRSDAVLFALIDTGSLWRFSARIALLIPRRGRDWLYDAIAARRHHFVKGRRCPLPSAKEQSRILP